MVSASEIPSTAIRSSFEYLPPRKPPVPSLALYEPHGDTDLESETTEFTGAKIGNTWQDRRPLAVKEGVRVGGGRRRNLCLTRRRGGRFSITTMSNTYNSHNRMTFDI
jgi:hypothetical protein